MIWGLANVAKTVGKKTGGSVGGSEIFGSSIVFVELVCAVASMVFAPDEVNGDI